MAYLYGYNEIIPGLYLSSGNAACNEMNAEKYKISCIVNCTHNLPNADWTERRRDIKLCRVRVNYRDRPSEPIKNAFDTITKVINEELKIGGAVLVHCNMGVSRSTSVILAFLMKYRGMPLRRAFELVRSKRSCVNPNIGFWKQLIKYEEIIFHKNTVEFEIGPKGCMPNVCI